MMTSTPIVPAPSHPPEPFTDQLRLAAAAYLARFKGSSREHTESDLRCYLAWCAERGLDPLAARRPHLELYIRWMQEIRRFKPSTVSRRFSVAAGFYRTCVLDGIIEHSPAEHVRRPAVPAESPTLGFTHLQFEALLTAARESATPYDFALVAMLGLLGLRSRSRRTSLWGRAPGCAKRDRVGAWPSWLGVGPAGVGTSASLAARAVMASRSPSSAWRSSSVRSGCSSICSIPLLTSRSCPLVVFLGR
jgi:hypothetical protein